MVKKQYKFGNKITRDGNSYFITSIKKNVVHGHKIVNGNELAPGYWSIPFDKSKKVKHLR